jgi:two-component system C4-dicarboxylate transport sensor histidine kinase DctB
MRFDRVRWLIAAASAAGIVMAFWLSFGSAIRSAAIEQAQTEAQRRAGLEVGTLVSEINKFRVLPFVLTELPGVREALVGDSAAAQERLNTQLGALARQTGASIIYAIDPRGVVRAASNSDRRDSFVGHDFRFRPYFVRAMGAGADEYFAEGVVTSRPGLFLARRVGPAKNPVGVIVVKIEFDAIERLWRSDGPLSMVIDQNGIVLLSTDQRLRYHLIGPSQRARLEEIRRARQFGRLSLRPAPIRLDGKGGAIDNDGNRYIAVVEPLPLLGWRQLHLEPEQPIIAGTQGRIRFATLLTALGLAALLAPSFWAITRRRRLMLARAALEAEVSRRTMELRDAYAKLQREAADRQLADSRYRAAREELAQVNRLGSIGTITTSVAHELNQPVAAIRTAAENATKLLARGDDDKVTGNLELIVSLTQRIGTITGELLSYARRGRRHSGPAALSEVLDGALLLIGESFNHAGIILEVLRPAELPELSIEKIRLEQVLVNLLQNALDAVTGTPGALVRMSVEITKTHARVTVSDNGPGIPPELGENVFQPFVTGKQNGTGLGLGISREIIRDHGGTLDILPTDQGAAFCILLPLKSGDAR